ncbi:MAG: acylphosphatase [Candidatus Gracilibacteria bacterium]
MTKRVQLKVKGKVQGVFYRAETQSMAQSLGLRGYAQNNRDGSVTVVAVGEESLLLELIEWCRKGPSRAHVDELEITFDDPPGDESLEGFSIY